VVRRAVEDGRPAFAQAGVRLELALAEAPVPLLADATRMTQVVGNLLNNAAKFTQAGGGTRVSVSVEGEQAVVRVADDGIGMGAQTLRTLFEPFMQADDSLARTRGGLGLGLSLVKALVELHGGTVTAGSGGPGQGSEFLVRLPLGCDVERAAAASKPPSVAAPRRVLVVEDNLDAAHSLRDILELSGHQVEVAYDGQAALAAARVFRPQVVLCDIGLPQADGYELARQLRADAALQDVVLVAVTGYASAEDVERAHAAGFERHLAKPPSPVEIQRLLAELPSRGHPGKS